MTREEYLSQSIEERIDQAIKVLHKGEDALVWTDGSIGIYLSDVFTDALVEIRRLHGKCDVW